MIQVGVGTSTHRDPRQAGREAAERALRQAGLTSCDFVMLFATIGYAQPALLAAVRATTGKAPLAGCSGSGVIARQVCNESSHAVAVLAWKSDELRFHNVAARDLKTDPTSAGGPIGRQLAPLASDAKALFVFADCLTFSFDRFQQNLADVLGQPRLPIVGGMAMDNWAFQRSYQYHDDEVISDGVSAALLSGTGSIAFGVNHGCVPLGHERTITRCEGNTVFELDGKPIFDVLREYLSDEEMRDYRATSHICFGTKAPASIASQYDEYIVRTITLLDHERGGIVIQTTPTPGTKVSMVRRDVEKMQRGVETLGARMQAQLEGRRPKLVFHFDCAGRGSLLFSEQDKTSFVTRLHETFDADVPWFGLYVAGELAPVAGSNFFHNYTVALTAIY